MALFDKSAATYDDWCSTSLGSFVDELEKRLMAEAAAPQPGEVAVDLGCGTGIYSLWLARQQLTVTGIDVSSEMLKRAREKASRQRLAIEFVQGDLCRLPFAENQFDLAICNVVLEFVDDPKRVIEEGLRVLKPGGRLVAGMIGKRSDWARNYEKRGQENSDSVFSHARFYSLAEIRHFAQQQPSSVRFGLYISPSEFESVEQAAALEQTRSASQQEEGAGFLVARWDKLRLPY